VADPARRERDDAGPASATWAAPARTAALAPADAQAVASNPPRPIDTAAEETSAERAERSTEGVGVVAQDHDPDRTGTGARTTAGPPAATSAIAGSGVGPAIPGYEIEGELGRGGMGVVYKARQVRLNRAVALKMILAGAHAGCEAAARFLGEAEAVAKLQHPNIVQIFHIDEHDGCPYFEMEHVGGG
jgi:hypothetical protein